MFKAIPNFVLVAMLLVLFSCSKKTQPSQAVIETTETSKADTVAIVTKTDSVATVVKKAPVVRRPKPSVPKMIAVNDLAAKKSVDGRLYYDLQGRRYWKNYKDGKYYLYNKSMNTDEAFKKPN
jgi:hypothetical protein